MFETILLRIHSYNVTILIKDCPQGITALYFERATLLSSRRDFMKQTLFLQEL